MFCADYPDTIAGSTLVSDVDSRALHDALKRGRAKNAIMLDSIIDLFWLQVRHDFTLKLRWVSSTASANADGAWAGNFDMGLRATLASVYISWVMGRCPDAIQGRTSPFILVLVASRRVRGEGSSGASRSGAILLLSPTRRHCLI